jgi:hypothetical protein
MDRHFLVERTCSQRAKDRIPNSVCTNGPMVMLRNPAESPTGSTNRIAGMKVTADQARNGGSGIWRSLINML